MNTPKLLAAATSIANLYPDVFRTLDGHIYMATGNDLQWQRLISIPKFAECSTPARFSNAGRHKEREALFADLRAVFQRYSTSDLARDLTSARIPWAEVNDLYAVSRLQAIASKMTKTRMPSGRELNLQPLPVDLDGAPKVLSFAARYGEHTAAILSEVGFSVTEVQMLSREGIVAVENGTAESASWK
jgi:crotonobetainyl-CoA:carnitine CoA-transferase CaiB-like acyl-CoA transferase